MKTKRKCKHGLSGTPTHMAWQGMKQRCLNPKAVQFHDYGGRGIKVCERWMEFKNFLEDMGLRPDGLTLERINVNGNYEKSNCKWATQKDQVRNQRVTRRVRIEGREYIAADLSDISGLKTDTIVQRAALGLTLAEVVSPRKRVFTSGLALGGLASGAKKQQMTHCKHGHEFTDANTFVTPEGWRRCRTCRNERQLRYNRQKRSKA